MTTLENRPNTALLIIDVQIEVMDGTHDRDAVIANIGVLVDKARQEQVPVVWVQHNDEGLVHGAADWHIVPELTPGEGETVVQKNHADAFEDTGLETVLAGLGVGRLFVAGAQTDMCVRATLHGGFTRGYDTVLVGDAHTCNDNSEWGAPTPDLVIAHTNLYWNHHNGPGRTAGTVETKAVDFAASA